MLKKVFLLFALLGIWGIQVQAKDGFSAYRTGCKAPTVTVSMNKKTPTYELKAYSDLVRLCKKEYILGCTVSTYSCSHSVYLNDKGCKQLDFQCYPENFKVYILDDYPKGTCEYNAIRKHENLHVSAIQTFPKASVEKYLNKCIAEEVVKKKIKNGEEIYLKCARKTTSWMNTIKQEKNHEIDSYKKYHPLYFSKCKNWKLDPIAIEASLDRLLD